MTDRTYAVTVPTEYWDFYRTSILFQPTNVIIRGKNTTLVCDAKNLYHLDGALYDYHLRPERVREDHQHLIAGCAKARRKIRRDYNDVMEEEKLRAWGLLPR